jgi:hypothetical protein
MRLAKLQIVTLALLLGGLCLRVFPQTKAISKQHAAPHQHARTKAKAQPSVPQVQPDPAPQPPPPPPKPEELPSTPPEVTYRDSQLTIIAQNSTLSDILSAVRRTTGAVFDAPSTASERVVGRFGPGPARDVLAKLLNGSRFNYVMVGTVADPNSVTHVILTAKTGGETPPLPGAQQPSFQQAVVPTQPAPLTPDAAGEATDEEQQVDSAEQPSDGSDENTADQEPEEPANPNQPAVKTPEQLLQELQRQQQLLQQQQQLQPQGQTEQGQPQPGQPQPVPPGQRPQMIYSNPPQEKPQE